MRPRNPLKIKDLELHIGSTSIFASEILLHLFFLQWLLTIAFFLFDIEKDFEKNLAKISKTPKKRGKRGGGDSVKKKYTYIEKQQRYDKYLKSAR